MNHRIPLAAALLAATCFTASCSESSAASVAGTYTIDIEKTVLPIVEAQEGADKMTEAQKTQAMDTIKPMFEGTSLTLAEDMSYTGSAKILTASITTKGTWTISDGTITLNQTHENDAEKKETKTGTVTEDVITVEMDQGGKKVKLFFKKEAK